ncbi:MAG TPA: hypothetical protein VEK79_00305 [Thermoanaerobaculia bacterium]|nr:hypothetical protein [Thermoanaerobaculia bacterium]
MKKLGSILQFVAVLVLFISPSARGQQHGWIDTSGHITAGLHAHVSEAFPDVVFRLGNGSTGALRVFNPANLELLNVAADGSGILVSGNVRSTSASGSFSVGGVAPAGYQFYAATAAAGLSSGFQLRSHYNLPSTSFVANLGTYGTAVTHNRDPKNGSFVDEAAGNMSNAAQLIIGDTVRKRVFQVSTYEPGAPDFGETVRMVLKYDGNVGIGTKDPTARLDVIGNIKASGNIDAGGNINAKYQDVAEWVTATSDLEPGTVVVLNPHRDNEVQASTRAYDTSVAGVVSAQPGVILGEAAATKETVATMGRVRVRVDATRAPIAIGDLLVTSERSGVAMKSLPIDLGGVAFHRPGTIIGKALQPLSEGEGEILVLLSLQ